MDKEFWEDWWTVAKFCIRLPLYVVAAIFLFMWTPLADLFEKD